MHIGGEKGDGWMPAPVEGVWVLRSATSGGEGPEVDPVQRLVLHGSTHHMLHSFCREKCALAERFMSYVILYADTWRNIILFSS